MSRQARLSFIREEFYDAVRRRIMMDMTCLLYTSLAADAVLFPPGNAGADKLILSHGARYLCLPA